MVTLRLRPVDGRWRASVHHCQLPDDQLREELADALAKGRASLLDWFRGAAASTDAIRLEIAKSAIADGEIALGLAHRLALACRSEPGNAHEVSGPPGALALSRILPALAHHGIRIDGELALGLRDRVISVVAIVAGFVSWWATVVSTALDPSRLPAGGELVFAVHGETSTRTRHLLQIASGEPAPRAIVLLGRPKASFRTIKEQWSSQFGQLPDLIRPWNFLSALRSFFPGLREARRLMGTLGSSPWRAPVWERAAMAYRVLSGTASSAWWASQRTSADLVVFGHTGLADTHMLEQAMQNSGVKTAHAAHGLSGGLNFIAFSSFGLWRCGADAKWHASMGTYGISTYLPARPSPHLPIGEGSLLVTSLAHPMNLEYRLWGIRPELELVQRLAETMAAESSKLSWRPHPSLWTLPGSERDSLLQAVEAMGVCIVRGENGPGSEIQGFRAVYCTPSTMVVDMAKSGCIPVLVGDLRFAGQLAFSAQPGGSERDSHDEDPPSTTDQSLWSRVEPGERVGIDYLLELARS